MLKPDAKKGMVYNIQGYSIHDGPGIRTTVFLKGCPLNCDWCSNPESKLPHAEIVINNNRCINCGRCIEVCHRNAISFRKEVLMFEREKCDFCLECAKACPTKAIERVGRCYTAHELIKEIEADRLFFINSGGGVTFSGGEPLFQADFLLRVLHLCKKHDVHTALDTCGFVPWEVMEESLNYVDLMLYDLKHLDDHVHKMGTGAGNKRIIENLLRAADAGKTRIWIRIPVIPGFNDNHESMEAIAELVSSLNNGGVEKVSLLPYHELGAAKYERLGLEYPYKGRNAPEEEKILQFKELFGSAGIHVNVGR